MIWGVLSARAIAGGRAALSSGAQRPRRRSQRARLFDVYSLGLRLGQSGKGLSMPKREVVSFDEVIGVAPWWQKGTKKSPFRLYWGFCSNLQIHKGDLDLLRRATHQGPLCQYA